MVLSLGTYGLRWRIKYYVGLRVNYPGAIVLYDLGARRASAFGGTPRRCCVGPSL